MCFFNIIWYLSFFFEQSSKVQRLYIRVIKYFRKSHHVQFDQRTITTPQESLEVVNDIDLPEVGMEEEISCVNAGIHLSVHYSLPTTYTQPILLLIAYI